MRPNFDTNLWRMKCEDEIPTHTCRSISNKLYPNTTWSDFNESKDNRLKWLRIYQSWNTWQNINETNISIEKFEPIFIRYPNVKITCLAVTGNYLAVGTSEGFIAFYDVGYSIREPIFTADQMSYVSNVQFYRHDCAGFTAVSSSDMDHVIMWNITSKRSHGKQPGRLISTTSGCLCIAVKHQLKVINKDGKNVYDISPFSGTISALVAEGDQAVLLTDLGTHVKVNLVEPYDTYVQEYIEPPTERVCKYYLFGPSVAACVTRDGFLGISINCGPWVMYEILSKLHGVPTAVLFYSNVLVLGLDSGSVHMYHANIKSQNDWDFRSENSKAIIVDNQAIVALDIMDRPNEQYLIAATAEKVNIINITYDD